MRFAIAILALYLMMVVFAAATREAPPPPRIDRHLHAAAARYHADYPWLVRVSWCESRWNPRAIGHGSVGLFQFLPSTWQTTPYRRYSIFSPWAQAMAAAWMYVHGRAREWVCR